MAPSTRESPRAWQRMLSGRRLDLLDPSPLDVEIEDIAHGLARVARWNGQTEGTMIFSVAQHSLLVEAVARKLAPNIDRGWRLAVLLHDAPEYVIGDLISPLKAAFAAEYKTIENRLLAAISVRFGLPPAWPPALSRIVKQADRGAAFLEAPALPGSRSPKRGACSGRRRVSTGPPRSTISCPGARKWPRAATSSGSQGSAEKKKPAGK